jgi:hypothetical protein
MCAQSKHISLPRRTDLFCVALRDREYVKAIHDGYAANGVLSKLQCVRHLEMFCASAKWGFRRLQPSLLSAYRRSKGFKYLKIGHFTVLLVQFQ